MELETILLAAIQSSFLLGLLHGVNPCGHSWLVLAPFISGEKKGSRVALLTMMFLGGTAAACLLLGATLGAVSQVIPSAMGMWVEIGTSIILIIIGLLLLYDPHILHSHKHDREHNHHTGGCTHNHHHTHDHNHSHSLGLISKVKQLTKNRELLPPALFLIGFVNMIIPCPTAAVMYTYALNASSIIAATIVFGTYAISTAIAVGAVIYLIFRATKMAHSLQKDWVEPFIMRFAGVVIIVFSVYGLYQGVTT
ncbi:MAG: sulfite exporter TauE/SafE family protein [Desulfobulbaceae bacterium]|nr:MAG: sulfite exporter TauE/SafE family protein [Desulfobulbaceae bacterium]